MGKRKRKLCPGDVFAIPITIGYGLFQYVEVGKNNIELVRVLRTVIPAISDFSPEMCMEKERYYIRMLVASAEFSGLIQFIDSYPLPDSAAVPRAYRSLVYVPQRNIRDWYLVDHETWKRVRMDDPDEAFFQLSPAGIWNADLLRMRLEENWSLENWR